MSSAGSAHKRPVAAGESLHPFRFFSDRRGMSVGFHQKHGFAIQGKPDLREILDAADRGAVEKLEGAREPDVGEG